MQVSVRDEKQTHRLFPIHGLHPQLPFPLWESLESDWHISMETVTDTIKVLQWSDTVSSSASSSPRQRPTSVNAFAKDERITTSVQEQRLGASLKYPIKSHVWTMRHKCEEAMMTFSYHNLTVGDAKLDAKFKLDAARRQMNQLLRDTTCVMRLTLSAKCTN